MSETAKWVLQISAAIVCAVFVYQYIVFKIEFRNEVNEWRQKEEEKKMKELVANNPSSTKVEFSLDDILKQINEMFDHGFMVGLDASLMSKYPQITEYLNHELLLVTEEVAKAARIENNVVGIQHFKGLMSQQDKTLNISVVNDSFVRKIGLDYKNVSDRAIGSYLYAEKTNLINVKFVTLDQNSFERATLVGLRAVLF
ncbi:hypothetical protein EHV15_35445 [Paenibacillus oralis]|uniref:Uncharacterized protein n=1 Tax=Paenibacillus oralis TaxID=2490856 RepID=A0A3P3TA02_9BACL|nr:hypothetical protein [Paenibacillus oralis]RRJ54871.1 hypothetical protein EHV15_35445 [Paenibacillus oralis]